MRTFEKMKTHAGRTTITVHLKTSGAILKTLHFMHNLQMGPIRFNTLHQGGKRQGKTGTQLQ